ncbi:reverse transcriptase (RNA-dependent DNA polymerase) domain-containing protein [Phthorimaea operculella]|nr:reverse transcriptase (RNA-dependent DNA polymerase) domain-containing protein [Phthorimaea operculella]
MDYTSVILAADGDLDCKNPEDITNVMNKRFADAAVACGAPPADCAGAIRLLREARTPSDRCLRLGTFSAEEVERIIKLRVAQKQTRDIYDLSVLMINAAANTLSSIFAYIFNRCIKEGVFPAPLKKSKISPLYKGKGSRGDIDAYRPVSIIPIVAKIFENGLCSRVSAFLASTDALSDRQYAYREGRSTTCLAREVVRRIVEARDRRQEVAVLCCDLSKAFDVADHNLLAAKLEHYGFSGPTHSLLIDILRQRSQVVVAHGGKVSSDPVTTCLGVAQGSSISNILFSLLLNDLPEAISNGETFMYADDVAIVVCATNYQELERKLNVTTSQVSRWFECNGLVLNLKKTHFLNFDLSGRSLKPAQVYAGGIQIAQVETTGFLGFQLDRGMTWEPHIDRLCGRVNGACFALRRVARIAPKHVVRTCYFAIVHSILMYGVELWGFAAEWERAFIAQKRAVRIIAQIPQDSSARPVFKSLRILTLPSLVILHVAIYVRKNLSAYAKYSDLHSHNTRSAAKLVPVRHRLAKASKLTHVMGPSIYNKLPDEITEAASDSTFQIKLKSWLIEKTFYSISEFLTLKK